MLCYWWWQISCTGSQCADVLWVCSDDCVDCGTVKGAVQDYNDKKNNSTKHTKLGTLSLVPPYEVGGGKRSL